MLMLMAASVRAALPDDYKVVLLTENFPPFNMAEDGKNYAADRNVTGINADIVREMFKRAGIAYSLTLRFPWERIYNQVLERPDQGLFSTTYTPEREPLFKWVGPLASTGWVLLAPPGSPLRLSSLEQARQYRIGAYKNDAVSQHLESKGFEPINSLRDQENIGKLLKGQIDLWATTDPVGPYLAKQDGVSGLATVLRFNDAQLFLALNKQTPDEVVSRLQKALNEMKEDGAIDAIMRRYL
jgi:polar amino acid transport system substrate-binding protein